MKDIYETPLGSRYASKEMQYLFSPDMKFRTWRRLWIALAETEQELGLDITPEQIEELKAHAEDINYEVAQEREKIVRHDVMSHVYAYGQQCPKAAGIIHLGATSCYVGDNTDVIVMNEAMKLIRKKLVNVIAELAKFADQYKELPTLAFTHFQPAQPTTVGKRAALWLQDLVMDLEDVQHQIDGAKLLGCKGTTGTQASFLELFDGDHAKCRELDRRIAEKMGYTGCFAVSGQTYSRKLDSRILNVLSGIAQSATKFSNDIRLLQHLKEIEEPFEKGQIGSSAMAYKRNPMRSERIASLARYVMVDALNPAITAATQWFERTLDDSANKRISIPEAFLAVDGILSLYLNVVDGLVVYPKVIEQRLMKELPFMATENIMMDAVKRGGNRQELHERIRVHSMEAGRQVKVEGKENDLLERIAADEAFGVTLDELKNILDPAKYVGRSPEQVTEFLTECVNPLLEQYKDDPEISAALVYYTPAATQFVNLNLNGPEFQDIKVREALSLAINRQELCDTILSGAALPCTGFIPPSESGSDPNGTVLEYNVDRAKECGSDPNGTVLEYNVDRAKELLAEAGNPTISFTAKVRPVDENVMVAIQAKWQEIGVDCKVETMDPQQWRDDRAAGNLVCTLVTWSTLSFVGVEHMGSFFTSDKASLRSSFYNSPEFDAYVQAARSAMDEAEVTENTIKADNKLVREDFGTIPVDWPQNPYVLREGFNGLEVLVDFHFKHVTKA